MKKVLLLSSAILLLLITAASLFITNYLYYHSLDLTNSQQLIYMMISIPLMLLIISMVLWQQVFSQHRKTQQLYQQNNVTDLKLHEQESLFNTAFRNSNNGIALVSLDGRIFKTNKALSDLLGYDEHELQALNFYYLVQPNELSHLQLNIQKLIENKISVYQSEQECFCKNGEAVWVMSTVSLIHSGEKNQVYLIAQIQNITLQKKTEERLKHMAYHDPLTGLANRNKLEQFVNHIIASSRRHQQGFALVFIDLDRFKNINDTIGHDAGDLLLQIIAERLQNVVRNTDMVARMGGDEFVLVVTDVKKTESVAIIARKILEGILQEIILKGHEIYITTSIGISLYPYDGNNMEALMKSADLALYRAKEFGRNNYQFYTAEMTSRAQEKMALQNAIGHALVKNEFDLHYLPKLNIKSQKITGVEALLRWKNQEFGTITPDEIIRLAEETALIIQVSDWVLKHACKQLKMWHQMGFTSLAMSVNCSERQFKQATFVDEVLRTLTELQIPPQSLEIEVTESTIMKDPENTLRVLYALKDLGVKIVIDDFGTGYWSLGNLRRLSVDKIKIDKSFIKQLTTDETSAAITSAIIGMVNRLGITSVAEGVETREQYDFLVREGCAEIQGYYLSQPLAYEPMTRFLQHPIPVAEITTDTTS